VSQGKKANTSDIYNRITKASVWLQCVPSPELFTATPLRDGGIFKRPV